MMSLLLPTTLRVVGRRGGERRSGEEKWWGQGPKECEEGSGEEGGEEVWRGR